MESEQKLKYFQKVFETIMYEFLDEKNIQKAKEWTVNNMDILISKWKQEENDRENFFRCITEGDRKEANDLALKLRMHDAGFEYAVCKSQLEIAVDFMNVLLEKGESYEDVVKRIIKLDDEGIYVELYEVLLTKPGFRDSEADYRYLDNADCCSDELREKCEKVRN